jgi:phosphate transport system substrate-binding protein
MEPGKRIGDYEMVRPLGVGGMAQVWMAKHPRMNRQFAVKFILDQFAGNHEIESRFHDEAWRQSMLQSRNIVAINTVVTEGGRDYIIMEYVENGLDKRLHELNGQPLPVPEAVNIELQLLDALHYAHNLPEGALIHRDIKPSNVLLTADGTVKLTDFGIALATSEARKTMTGQALGTAFYMSPEQIVTPAAVDMRTDIYSAGCVLYEMLTGRPPFGKDGDTDYFIQNLHVNQTPDPLRRWNPSIPENFEWIVLKALAKDPNKRFQTCREMAAALLVAYREAGLPVAQLTSYSGGLTAPPIAQTTDLRNQGLVAPPSFPPLGTRPPEPAWLTQPQVQTPVQPPPGPSFGPGSGPTEVPVRLTGPGISDVPPVKTPWFRKPLTFAVAALLLLLVGVAIWYYTRPQPKVEIVSDNIILRLEGSTSVGDKLAPALAAAYLSQSLHATDVRTDMVNNGKDGSTIKVQGMVHGSPQTIQIVSNGSGKAFIALLSGQADLGMSSRPYVPGTRGGKSGDPFALDYLASSNEYEHVIALDGIAVIVNPNNHVQSLTMAQLKQIFTGQVTDWSEVGGSPGAIHCYGREASSGTFEMFRNAVVGSTGSLSAIRKVDELTEGKAVVDHVANDPNGIGYVTFTQAEGVNSVALSDTGTQFLLPTSLTVSTEDYLLTRRLFLYQPQRKNATASAFMEFVRSQPGQDVVKSNHFVPLIPELHSATPPADAPADYVADTRGLRRLGLSFRFVTGKVSIEGNNYQLDNLARDNVDRLREYIEAHPDDKLTLIGFADSTGNAADNRKLSIDRARSVADELSRTGITAAIAGLGAEMPVATNSTEAGKAKNRRVEVWVGRN